MSRVSPFAMAPFILRGLAVVLMLLAAVPATQGKMRGFNFNGYKTGPSSFTVPAAATYGRVMDVSIAGADPIGAPWWGHLHLGPNEYNWTGLDLLVSAMRAENPQMCLLFPIWGTPTWLASDPASCSPSVPNQCYGSVFQSFPGCNTLPNSLVHWQEFVTALVTRYTVQQSVFYAYEIWNEPTNVMFLNSTNFGPESWELLAEMVYTAKDIIKKLTKGLPKTPCLESTDPSLIGAYVLAPSLIFDGKAHMVKLAHNVLQGILDYKKKNSLGYMPADAMTCHVYNQKAYNQSVPGNIAKAGEAWGLLLDACCKLLVQYGMPHPNQPWLTEIGYTVDKDHPQYTGSFAYKLVHTTYNEAWARLNRNIDNIFWYSWNLQEGGVVMNEAGGVPSAGFQSVIDNAL